MCLKYRMGVLNNIASTFKSMVPGNNGKNRNNSAMPVTNPYTPPTSSNANAPNQTGGVAPVNFRYPPNMQQPSDAVMKWATTAGMPAPPDMRGVARGGKRRTRRRTTKKRHTKRHTKRRVHKRKTHRRKTHRHGKRRN